VGETVTIVGHCLCQHFISSTYLVSSTINLVLSLILIPNSLDKYPNQLSL